MLECTLYPLIISGHLKFIFFFFREFQLMASAHDKHYLSSEQDTNQF